MNLALMDKNSISSLYESQERKADKIDIMISQVDGLNQRSLRLQ